MGWSIGLKTNTLKVSEEVATKLIEAGESNDYYLGYDSKHKTLKFDLDAMEWMDCVDNDWFLDTLKSTDSNGDVVFMSAEGDNRGEIWGYRFKNGDMKTLTAKVTMVEDN